MASPTTDKAVPSGAIPTFISSLHNEQGLNFAYLGQSTSLRLRVANTSPQHYQTQLLDNTSRQLRIRVDFSQAADKVQLAPPQVPHGFKVQMADDGSPAFDIFPTLAYWVWFRDEVITIDVPGVTLEGDSGCGFVQVTVDYLESQWVSTSEAPLFRLMPPVAATAQLMRAETPVAAFRVDNSINISDSAPGGGVLKLKIANESGFIRPSSSDGHTPAFYVMLSDGLAPGLASLTSAELAQQIEAKSGTDSSWIVERIGNSAYPVWRLTPDPAKPSTTGDVDLKLSNILAGQRTASRGHLVVYTVNVPGAADNAQVLGVRMTPGSVVIQSFTADKEEFFNINGPVEVLLSWQVQNAEFVTLTNLGVVDAERQNQAMTIEQTTNFVLTAYSASLSQIVSKTLRVSVTPDLATRVVPKGTIMLWSGDTTNVPTGWALCDGQNGRPDLRDKFVMGAGMGDGYTAPNKSGPADKHTHAIKELRSTFQTSQVGDHTHGMPTNWYARNLSCGKWTGIDTRGAYNANTQSQGGGKHSHSVDVVFPAFNSEPNDHDYRPAWYALCYIIKQGV